MLEAAALRGAPPGVLAYNRIDGPGSSIDLREVQQAFWKLPPISDVDPADPAMPWSSGLPRTVAITIDTGTQIDALPFEPGRISVRSVDYDTEVSARPGEVLPTAENWLLKIVELFGLSGVQFVLHNVRPGIESAGLGGSATAATGVCILANELAGRPFGPVQLLSMASRMEQEMGVSLTGTQEQSNVVFGGVTDYVWFPWGVPRPPLDSSAPGEPSAQGVPNAPESSEISYGSSVRRTLVSPDAYAEIESRMAIFHTGLTRASTDTNSVWMAALVTPEGYRAHKRLIELAYRYAEGLRTRDWVEVAGAIRGYREVRTAMCPEYVAGAGGIIDGAERRGCTAFPLGAGGGGGVLVFGGRPDDLRDVRGELAGTYEEIPYKIMTKGHGLINFPIESE